MTLRTMPPELGADEDERRWLVDQAAMLEHEARSLLDPLDVPIGGDVIDIGCGPVGVLRALSARVGRHGQVTGLDRRADILDHAARACAGLGNVHVVLGDATGSSLPRATFDLAHVRGLLANVPDPAAVVGEAVAIVRPGGTVAFQEADWLSWQCEPDIPAWGELCDVLLAFRQSRGLDPCVGRRLPPMLRASGLREVQATALAGIDSAGHPTRRLILRLAERCRDRILAAEFTSETHLDTLVGAVDRHLADPGTVVVRPMTVQAWGRVPGTAGRKP